MDGENTNMLVTAGQRAARSADVGVRAHEHERLTRSMALVIVGPGTHDPTAAGRRARWPRPKAAIWELNPRQFALIGRVIRVTEQRFPNPAAATILAEQSVRRRHQCPS